MSKQEKPFSFFKNYISRALQNGMIVYCIFSRAWDIITFVRVDHFLDGADLKLDCLAKSNYRIKLDQ